MQLLCYLHVVCILLSVLFFFFYFCPRRSSACHLCWQAFRLPSYIPWRLCQHVFSWLMASGCRALLCSVMLWFFFFFLLSVSLCSVRQSFCVLSPTIFRNPFPTNISRFSTTNSLPKWGSSLSGPPCKFLPSLLASHSPPSMSSNETI